MPAADAAPLLCPQSSAPLGITTTPVSIAAFAALWAPISLIFGRITASPVLATPPPTLTAPPRCPSAKVGELGCDGGGDRHGVNRGPSSKVFKNPLKQRCVSFLWWQARGDAWSGADRALQACPVNCPSPSGCATGSQSNLLSTSCRPAVRGGAGRVHRLHRVPQLPGELPCQRRVYLEHQPTAQAQDPHRGARDLPPLRG